MDAGQRQEVLAQQERAERGAQAREDDAPQRVLPAHARDQDVVGQDGHLRRHHERDQDEDEDDVLEGEADKDQGVGREDGQDDLDGGAHGGDDQAVHEEPRERHRGHRHVVVVQVHAFRQDLQVHRDDLAGLLEGAQHHPEQRKDDHERGQDERDVAAGDGLDQVGAGKAAAGAAAGRRGPGSALAADRVHGGESAHE